MTDQAKNLNQLLTGLINGLLAPQQAIMQGLGELTKNNADNWPYVEKEILKFHATILHNCLDVVNSSLAALEAREQNGPENSQAMPPGQSLHP